MLPENPATRKTGRILSIALIVAAAAFFMVVGLSSEVSASTPTHGDCGDGVTYNFNDATGTLYISGNGRMWDCFSSDQYPWAAYSDQITALEIGDGVTHIGRVAFEEMKNLTTITIGKGVVSIGMGAFYNTTNVTTINYNAVNCTDYIPERYTWPFVNIGIHGSGITLNIGDDVKTIPKGLFFYDSTSAPKITTVNLGKGMTSINEGAFANSRFIETIAMPDWIKSVEKDAFNNCKALTSIDLRNVTYIGDSAFRGCKSLVNVNFGTLSEIGENAFRECKSLQNGGTLKLNAVKIGYAAFMDCTSIQNLVIDNNTEVIGQSAFMDCTSLVTVDVGEYVAIGMGINGQPPKSYTEIRSSHIKTIGSHAFEGCVKLNEFYIGEGSNTKITEISEYTFKGCTWLRKFTVPNGIRDICVGAFEKSGLVSIDTNKVVKVHPAAFEYSNNLVKVTIRSSVKEIGYNAFYDCGIKSLAFENGGGAIKISSGAFSKNLSVPNSSAKNGMSIIYNMKSDYNNSNVRGKTFVPHDTDNRYYIWQSFAGFGASADGEVDKITYTDSAMAIADTEDYTILSEFDVEDMKAAAAANKSVIIKLTNGSIVLDPASVASLIDDIQTISMAETEYCDGSAYVARKVADRPIYNISIGDTHKFGGKITVTLNYELRENEDANDLCIWYLKEDGTYETIPCTYNDGKVTFVTDHLSDYAIMSVESNDGIGMIPAICVIAAIVLISAAAIVLRARETDRS